MHRNSCILEEEGGEPLEERKGLLGRVMEKCVLTARLHQNYLKRELEKTGISKSQRQLLLDIEENPGATQREIAARRNVSTASVAVTVKRLEREGYLVKDTDQKDSRRSCLRLTSRGQKAADESRQLLQHTEASMFSGFSEEEILQFEKLLNRLIKNGESLLQEESRENRNTAG